MIQALGIGKGHAAVLFPRVLAISIAGAVGTAGKLPGTRGSRGGSGVFTRGIDRRGSDRAWPCQAGEAGGRFRNSLPNGGGRGRIAACGRPIDPDIECDVEDAGDECKEHEEEMMLSVRQRCLIIC